MIIEEKKFNLKNGREAILRSPREEDAASILEFVRISSRETDFLTRYPEEYDGYSLEQEKSFLEENNSSPNKALIMCVVDNRVVGNCVINFFDKIKTKHRASIGIALISEFWNQGIGTKMFEEIIHLAESREGVTQLELEFIEGNARARYLYEKMGFRIVSVHPNAFRLKDGTFLHSYLMIKEINKKQ